MKENRVIPELEVFDLSMIEAIRVLYEEGTLQAPLHFNFTLGFKGALPATSDNIFRLKQALPHDSSWSVIHEGMEDFSLLAVALGSGASAVRVGYEDGFYLKKGKPAKNSELVKHAVQLIEAMGYEVATVEEARELLGINK